MPSLGMMTINALVASDMVWYLYKLHICRLKDFSSWSQDYFYGKEEIEPETDDPGDSFNNGGFSY